MRDVTPRRIRRRRTKGWKTPPNTVYVGRPTMFGNPFIVGVNAASAAGAKAAFGWFVRRDRRLWRWARKTLRGKNLACWCPLGTPCHADVLLAIANGGAVPKVGGRKKESAREYPTGMRRDAWEPNP